MKKIVLLLMLGILLIAGCSNQSKIQELQKTVSEVQKIEIYHFHGNTQCYSCKTVGAYAEETVNTYFAEELNSGKIVFAHINMQLPENKELVKKYEVTSSALWLGVYDKDVFQKEVNNDVWYKINNKEEYMSYLKSIIEKRLSGDLS